MRSDRKVSFEEDVVDLVELLKQSRVTLRPNTFDLLVTLSRAIESWNSRVNLISRKDIGRLVRYHFCDSASLLPILSPRRNIRMLDVGGSNGLPGLVLSAISPYVRVTICDVKLKRRGFLEDACGRLGGGVSFELDRVNGEGFQGKHNGMFDLIVARAVTRLKLLVKWCLPLLRPSGLLVAYKGSRCLEEVAEAEEWLFGHGGDMISAVRSPWMSECNPLRLFAIARRRS